MWAPYRIDYAFWGKMAGAKVDTVFLFWVIDCGGSLDTVRSSDCVEFFRRYLELIECRCNELELYSVLRRILRWRAGVPDRSGWVADRLQGIF